MSKEKFNPLMVLAALGAGGIAVMPFAFFQYTHHTGKGLITFDAMGHGSLPLYKEVLFLGLEGVMITFALLHFALLIHLFGKMIGWMKTDAYTQFIGDPLKNAGILAPFLALAMSMNVVIGPTRFFIPMLAENLQAVMLPALIAWGLIWAATLRMEIKLLKISFEKSFDVSKVNFGWLLHPFALAMVTVTGTGIAAMAQAPAVSHTAAFMSLVTGTMALFMLGVKLNSIFKSHFAATGLPAKQFLPSFLIVVPIITVLGISGFRLTHYMERQHDFHMHWAAWAIVAGAFAFQTWYMAFGLSMLKGYFKNHFFNKEFHISQWGLICPFVAYAVMGSFFFKLVAPVGITAVVIGVFMLIAVSAYALLMSKQLRCSSLTRKNENHDCASSLLPQSN